MADLSIKKVPEHLHLRLKRRAQQHHRSLNGEVLAILEEAVAAEGAEIPDRLERIRELRSRFSGELTAEEVRAAIEEGRR